MGLTFADITLTSSEDLLLLRKGYIKEKEVKSLDVTALIDTGASMLTIPRSVQEKLGLPKINEQNVELGNGSIITVDVVGPVEIKFENRITIATAVVLPDEIEVLLGAIPLQAMDVLIDVRRERLIVNPQSPDKARLYLHSTDKILSPEQLRGLKVTGEDDSKKTGKDDPEKKGKDDSKENDKT